LPKAQHHGKQEPSCRQGKPTVLVLPVCRYIQSFIYLFDIEIVLFPVKLVSVNK